MLEITHLWIGGSLQGEVEIWSNVQRFGMVNYLQNGKY